MNTCWNFLGTGEHTDTVGRGNSDPDDKPVKAVIKKETKWV